MRSLLALEQALLEDNFDDIKVYLSEIDRKDANERFRLLGEHLGLTTMEIEGVCYASLSRAAQILGYKSESGLRKLMGTYQIMTPKIGWFALQVRTRIRETFKLDEKDSQATFVPYEGILIAGMQGTTEQAKKIKLYLLKCENALWEGIKTLDQFKLEAYRLNKIVKTITLAGKLSNMPDGTYKDAAIEAFERLTGKTFPKSGQLKLPGM